MRSDLHRRESEIIRDFAEKRKTTSSLGLQKFRGFFEARCLKNINILSSKTKATWHLTLNHCMLNAFLPNPTTNIIIIIFESVFDWMFSWTFGRCVLVWWKGDLYLCQCETDHATYQQEHQVHSYRVTWIGKIIWPKNTQGFGAASVNAQMPAPWNTEPLRVGAPCLLLMEASSGSMSVFVGLWMSRKGCVSLCVQ